MLILTRKIGETVILNDNIKVTVMAIDGGQIKLGFDAPKSVSIVREELILAVTEQNLKATQESSLDSLSKLRQKVHTSS